MFGMGNIGARPSTVSNLIQRSSSFTDDGPPGDQPHARPPVSDANIKMHNGIPPSSDEAPSPVLPPLPPDVDAALQELLDSLSDVPEGERLHFLEQKYQDQAAALHRTSLMLNMYVHRSNSRWAEQHMWKPPQVWDPATTENWAGCKESSQYSALLCDALRAGRVAVQLYVDEEALMTPGGRAAQLWSSDAWGLVEECRPGCLPFTDRLEGLSLGDRALMQLAACVTRLAGKEALSQLQVVLHVSEGQAADVLQDLAARQLYGLSQGNVYVLTQPLWPGYRFDPVSQAYRRDMLAASRPLGSGYGMMRLAWVGDGLSLSEDGSWEPLRGSVLDTLAERGATWLVSRRLRDLSLLSSSSALDPDSLAYFMFLKDKYGANMGVLCKESESMVFSRAHDSIIMNTVRPRSSHPSSSQGGTDSPRLPPTPTIKTRSRHTGPYGVLAAGPDTSLLAPCCELRHSELHSPAMTSAVAAVKAGRGGAMLVGLGAYFFHVASLQALLTGMPLRPRLKLAPHSDLLHCHWDLADMSTLDRARSTALLTRSKADTLQKPEDMEFLAPLLQHQDHDGDFRRQVVAHMSLRRRVKVVPGVMRDGERGGQTIVVLIASTSAYHHEQSSIADKAVQMAMRVARPGRDVLELLTVVNTRLDVREAEDMLQEYYLTAIRCMATVRIQVLVRHPMPLLDVLDWHLSRTAAGLVVLGSTELTAGSALQHHNLSSSMAFAVVKRLPLPVLLVTANTRLPPYDYEKCAVQALTLVERQSRPLLLYMLTTCLDASRGDRLLLAQVQATRFSSSQQRLNYAMLMDNFADLAASHRMPVLKRLQLVGALHKELVGALEANHVTLLGLQLPPAGQITEAILRLVRGSTAGVLIYKQH